MLAVKMMKKDAIRVLCDHFANPKHKPFPKCKYYATKCNLNTKLDLTPMNLAVQLQEKEILKHLVAAKHKIKQFDFESLR